ncbi:MAG: iron-sulfur cluster assembly protein [Candidatus Thermoplasmatota archaeon]|nr:iron-sulfur cluster assembly protein [Candidatus Thermoplasmatota archaeon]
MNEIKEILKELKHPEINLDLVELGMIGRIREKENKVIIELKLPFLNIPIKQMLIDQIKDQLSDRVVEVTPCLMNNEDKSNFFILSRKHWAL